MFEFEGDIELEAISDLFLKELEKIGDMLEEVSYETEGEDEEGKEYREVYGGAKEDIKEYQEKFKEYVERIKEGLEKIYMDMERNKENEGIEPKMKSPWERGHKLGCGCPGCTAYREFHGIKLNESRNNQNLRMKPDLMLAKNTSEKKKYNEETDSKPCGGRLYNFFHGGEAELKTVFGSYTKRFDFRTMGY